MKYLYLLSFITINVLIAPLHGTSTKFVLEEETIQKISPNKKTKNLFKGEFAPSTIAKKIKEQLSKSAFTQFVGYYGIYAAYAELGFLISALTHELGHALVAQSLGTKVNEIVIGYPIFSSEPLLQFSLNGILIKLSPLPPLAYTTHARTSFAKNLEILASGPIAGSLSHLGIIIMLELLNQIFMDASLEKNIKNFFKGPLFARTSIKNSYQQWIISARKIMVNKPYWKRPFYLLQSLFHSDFRLPIIRLLQSISLFYCLFNAFNLTPFGGDGTEILSQLSVAPINILTLRILSTCAFCYLLCGPAVTGMIQGFMANLSLEKENNFPLVL